MLLPLYFFLSLLFLLIFSVCASLYALYMLSFLQKTLLAHLFDFPPKRSQQREAVQQIFQRSSA
nr:exported hypothetical protein [Bartonella sp. 1-1C]